MRDGDARRGLVRHLGQVGALDAGLGVLERVEVAGRQRGNRLGAHHHSSLLDDVEHLRDALVHLADEPALGRNAVLAEGQLAGGRDLQAHLVLDVGDEDAVALARLAGLGIEVELRHDEQRQALGARSGALGAGQHQMHDVLEHVVGVGGGDEPLDAVDVPGAVGLLDGLGAAGADVGTGVRLGQHHGGAPTALGGQHGPLLLLLGAQVVDDRGEAGAAAVHPHRRVGAEHMLVQRPQQRLGGRHAAELLDQADLVPAALDEGLDGLLEGCGDLHRVGRRIEHRRVAVALDEGVRERALGQASHLGEHFLGRVDVEVGEVAFPRALSRPNTSNRLKTWSRTLLL